MAKEYAFYIVLVIMILVIVVALIAGKNYSPPVEEQKNESIKNDTIDLSPQASISVQKPMEGSKVTVEAASSDAAKIKFGNESVWIDKGESYIFSNGLGVYIENINNIGPERNDYSVELWVA